MPRDTDINPDVYSDRKPGKSPLGVVKRDPTEDELDDILKFAASEVGLLYGALDQERLDMYSADNVGWEWENYQLRYFQTPGNWIGNKPRQVGVSAGFGALGMARGILARGNYTGIMVSYKKEEAISKIRYVKAFLDCLPLQFQKKIIRDPLHLVEWENRNGTISKVISHAQKPVRGHHGDVWLDEFHFFQQDKLIYDSILPVTARVGGTIHIASTPFGKGGMFYDIVSDSRKYPTFKREWMYWWWCRQYLKEQTDEFLFRAMVEAPKLSTPEERIAAFGNDRIRLQFYGLDSETFQQEFEGLFVDERAYFFSRQLIMSCMYDQATEIDEYSPKTTDFTIPIEEALAPVSFPVQEGHEGTNFKRYDSIEDLIVAVRTGDITPCLYAGVDVGVTQHSTDIRILEEVPMLVRGVRTTLQIERFGLNRSSWPLEEQQQFLVSMMKTGLIRKMVIDGGGIGFQMSQTLHRMFKDRVEPIRMNSVQTIRNELMNGLRNRMEAKAIALAFDRETIEDLHSIKTLITVNRNQRFITEQKRMRHGDRAWSLAFASYAGTKFGEEATGSVALSTNVVVPGYSPNNSNQRNAEEIEALVANREAAQHASRLKSKMVHRNNRGSMTQAAERINSGSSFGAGLPPKIRNWDD